MPVLCEPWASMPSLSSVLPQVKELGVVMYNCSCLARDLTKIFEAYWFLGQAGSSIPSTWPQSFDTRYNQETPMEICLNGTPALAYLAVSWEDGGLTPPPSLLLILHPLRPPSRQPVDCQGGNLNFTLSQFASSKAWAVSQGPSALD